MNYDKCKVLQGISDRQNSFLIILTIWWTIQWIKSLVSWGNKNFRKGNNLCQI